MSNLQISSASYNKAGSPAKVHLKYTTTPKTFCLREPPELAEWTRIEPADVDEDRLDFCKTCRKVWKQIKGVEIEETKAETRMAPVPDIITSYTISPLITDKFKRCLQQHILSSDGKTVLCRRQIHEGPKARALAWPVVDKWTIVDGSFICKDCKRIALGNKKPARKEAKVKEVAEEKFLVITEAGVYTKSELLHEMEDVESLRLPITDLGPDYNQRALEDGLGAMILRLKDLKPVKAKMTFGIEPEEEEKK